MAKRKKKAAKVIDPNKIVILRYYKHKGELARVCMESSRHPVTDVDGPWYKIQYNEGLKHYAYVLGEELEKMPDGFRIKQKWDW